MATPFFSGRRITAQSMRDCAAGCGCSVTACSTPAQHVGAQRRHAAAQRGVGQRQHQLAVGAGGQCLRRIAGAGRGRRAAAAARRWRRPNGPKPCSSVSIDSLSAWSCSATRGAAPAAVPTLRLPRSVPSATPTLSGSSPEAAGLRIELQVQFRQRRQARASAACPRATPASPARRAARPAPAACCRRRVGRRRRRRCRRPARGGSQRARSIDGELSCASMRHGLPPCALSCPLSCCCASDSCRPSMRSDCGA